MQTTAQDLHASRQEKFMKNIPEWLNHAVVALIAVFVFVIPFHFNTAIQEICFYTALFLAISLHVFKKKPLTLQSPLTLSFGLFVFWAFIGLFFALNKENSIHDFYGHLLKNLVLFYLIVNFYRTKTSFLLIAWALVVSISLFSLGLMIYFYVTLDHTLSDRLLSINIPTNIISVITIFPCMIAHNVFFRTKYLSIRIILVFCLFTIILSIIFTASRFSVSILILSLILMSLCVTNKRGSLLLAIFIMLLIFCFPVKTRLVTNDFMNDVKNDPRFFLSNPFVEIIKTYPVAGIGFGMDSYADKKILEKYNAKLAKKDRLDDQSLSAWYYPHNIYIDIATRLGFAGLLIFFYIVFSYFRTGWLIMKHSRDDFLRSWSFCLMISFLALLVIGMFESFLGFSVSVVLYVQCAMMIVLWRIHSEFPLQIGDGTSPQ